MNLLDKKDEIVSAAGMEYFCDENLVKSTDLTKFDKMTVGPLDSLKPQLPPTCDPPTCNPSPESSQDSSEVEEDNAICKRVTKPEPYYVGLVNQAMTCYLNSLLQTLYMTPEFRNALYNWEYVNGLEKDEINSIPYQLQKLFLNLQTSSKPAVETTSLTKSFGWDSTEAWQQHDIQELCRVMFDALEQKFKNTEQADLINRLYEGKMIDYVKCLECNTEKSREDTFLDIPLPVRPFGSNVAYNSVEDALRAFVQYEVLEGNNQYYCEKCNKKCDAHKGLKFKKFPYLLTLHLKRFDFDFTTFHRIKLNDKITFPDIFNLNHFLTSSNQESPSDEENTDVAKCDDSSSTADSGTLCENSLPNSYNSTNCNQDDHDEGIDMSSGQSTSNCTAHNYENEKNHNSNAAKGPYTYELFSIMIHSGSASGGHYYAYIKDFMTGEWLCFNDQSVNSITHDDIQKTYGGGPSRSYYTGSCSSTNAYMLMYRQIDPERNTLPMQVQDFPQHIQELLKKMSKTDAYKTDKTYIYKSDGIYKTDKNYKTGRFYKKEIVLDMDKKSQLESFNYQRLIDVMYNKDHSDAESTKYTVVVFCKHPTENETYMRSLNISINDTLAEITKLCYEVFQLENVVSLDQCRLLKCDEDSDTIICSFEGRENDNMLLPLLSSMSSKQWFFLLEIRDKDKKFEPYQGDFLTKVNVVDLFKKRLIGRVYVRTLYKQTIKEFKEVVGKIFNMNPNEMTIFVEQRTTYAVVVDDDNVELTDTKFRHGINVYISTTLNKEYRLMYNRLLHKIIENFQRIIVLYFALPDTSPEITEEQNVPSQDEKYQDKEKPVVGSPSKTNVSESQFDATDFEYSSDVSNSEKCNDTAPVRNISPQLGESEEWNSSEQSNSEDSSLSDSDKTLVGDVPEDNDLQVLYNANNCALVMMNHIELENLEFDYYFKATYCDKKYLQVQVDERMNTLRFKKLLEPYVGVPMTCFTIHRLFDCMDKSVQMMVLNTTMDTLEDAYRDGQKFVIKIDRPLRNKEINVKIYHFTMDVEISHTFLCDWIVSEDMTIGEAKKDLMAELKKKLNMDIVYERCRLRDSYLSLPHKVLLDDQIIGSLPQSSAQQMVWFLQLLPDVESVTNSNEIVVFIRRWYPSKTELEPLQEIVLQENSVQELRKQMAAISDIPQKYISIAKPNVFGHCNMSDQSDQNCLKWTEQSFEGTFNICDTAMFLYRDIREESKELVFSYSLLSERPHPTKVHHVTYSTSRSTRKEKALTIQLNYSCNN